MEHAKRNQRDEQEEKEAKEKAEYEKWSGMIKVSQQGEQTAEQREAALQRMAEWITKRQVVMIEEVASEFKITAKDVVTRIAKLEEQGRLSGITDDRGKYI